MPVTVSGLSLDAGGSSFAEPASLVPSVPRRCLKTTSRWSGCLRGFGATERRESYWSWR